VAHIQIGNQDIELLAGDDVQRLGYGAGDNHLVPVHFKNLLKGGPNTRIIINEENAGGGHGAPLPVALASSDVGS
jgi:hypothetical protein